MTPRDVVLAYYAAVDGGNLDLLLALFHPDAQYRRGGYPTLHGTEQLRHFYTNTRIIEKGRHIVRTILSNGADVAVRGEFLGSSRTGEPLAIDWSDFFTVVDGLIRTRHTYFMAPGV